MSVIEGKVKGEDLPWVYGPVQSRRHGLSLGVNLGVAEHKICTWSCLYCQCGFGERREFHAEEVRPELRLLLSQIKEKLFQNPEIQSITLAGNTEPGTYPEIEGLIQGLQQLRLASRGKWKISILSNGSELDQLKVLSAFQKADEVWLKLDCGEEDSFHRLNRPLPKIGTLLDHLARLKKVKNLKIQTLLWANEKDEKLMNTTEKNLKGLLACYQDLQPISIHLMTVERDPALPGVVPAAREVLTDFSQQIQNLGIHVQVW